MERTSVWRLSVAALAGVGIASCNLALGLDGYGSHHGGSGGSSTTGSGTTGSSTSSTGGGGNTTTTHSGDAGDAGDAGDGGDPTRGLALWAKSFGNGSEHEIGGVAVDADGDVYVGGWFQGALNFQCPDGPLDTQGPKHGFVLKLSGQDGSCVWQREIWPKEVSPAYATVNAIAVDGMKNVIIGGSYKGTIQLSDTASAKADGIGAFVASLSYPDAGVKTNWARYWPMAVDKQQVITSLALDANGQVYVAGAFAGSLKDLTTTSSVGGTDFFMLRLSPTDGSSTKMANGGGAGMETLRSIAVSDLKSTVVAVGSTDGSFTVDPDTLATAGLDDVLVLRASADFATLSGVLAGDNADQQGRSCAFDGSGGLYLAGHAQAGIDFGNGVSLMAPANPEAFLARFDDSGKAVHALKLGAASPLVPQTDGADAGDAGDAGDGGPAEIDERGICVATDSSDPTVHPVVVAASLKGQVTIPKYSLTTAGSGHDLVVVKLAGDLQSTLWGKSFGKSGDQDPTGVAADTEGNVLVGGHYHGSLDFGNGYAFTSTSGGRDIFIAKLKH